VVAAGGYNGLKKIMAKDGGMDNCIAGVVDE
jgi:hypothetical protein